MMPDCLHGDEQVIYGDTAYVNTARKEEAEGRGGAMARVTEGYQEAEAQLRGQVV